jgi:hypothetical protein
LDGEHRQRLLRRPADELGVHACVRAAVVAGEGAGAQVDPVGADAGGGTRLADTRLRTLADNCSPLWAHLMPAFRNEADRVDVAALQTDKDTLVRFWEKVETTDTCWLWRGGPKDPGVYGQFTLHGRQELAHRFAYESLVGPIPSRHTLDHLCRNPRCVNPEHLEPVTHRENILRGTSPAAANARKTHCPRGHPYDEENTVMYRGGRYCRACRRRGGRDG